METSVGLSNVEGRGNLNFFTFPSPQKCERTLESEGKEKTWNRPPVFWWTFQRQEKGNISNSFTVPCPQQNERTLESECGRWKVKVEDCLMTSKMESEEKIDGGNVRRTFHRQRGKSYSRFLTDIPTSRGDFRSLHALSP